ncbi:MAG: hypothetical protein ACREX8_09120, partial [Gammaproteobacteria bacterium]
MFTIRISGSSWMMGMASGCSRIAKGWRCQLDCLPAADDVPRLYAPPIDLHPAREDPGLERGAGVLR